MSKWNTRAHDSPKVWPLGCRKPSNCEQRRACVYTCSAHAARDQIDVANEIDAAVAGVIAGPLNPIKCGGIREATAVEWDALMSEIDAKKAARA